MNKTTETVRAAESRNLTRRYAAPLIVMFITFAVLVIGVLLLTIPNRLIAAFSARYLGLILTAVPYLIVAAVLAALFEAYRPALTTKLPRATMILVALAPVFHPVALFASLRAFPDRPEIVLGRVVAGLVGVSIFFLFARFRAPSPSSKSSAIDTVARVLYDDFRFFLLGALVFAVLHFVLQAPRPGAPPIPVTIAIPFALVLGIASGIPNAVLPLAALLVSDRFPPAATVVLLASGAVLPMNTWRRIGKWKTNRDGPRVPRRVFAGVLGVYAVMVAVLLATGRFSAYVPHTWIPYGVFAAVVFAALAVREATASSNSAGIGDRGIVVFFLPLVVLGVSLVAAGASLGELRATRALAAMNRDSFVDSITFDPGSSAEIPDIGPIVLSDDRFYAFYTLLYEEPETFLDREIRFEGFVFREPHYADDEFVVARYFMWCCGSDAVMIGLAARLAERELPDEDTWVEVVGRLTSVDRYFAEDDETRTIPLVELELLRQTVRPRFEYILPY